MILQRLSKLAYIYKRRSCWFNTVTHIFSIVNTMQDYAEEVQRYYLVENTYSALERKKCIFSLIIGTVRHSNYLLTSVVDQFNHLSCKVCVMFWQKGKEWCISLLLYLYYDKITTKTIKTEIISLMSSYFHCKVKERYFFNNSTNVVLSNKWQIPRHRVNYLSWQDKCSSNAKKYLFDLKDIWLSTLHMFNDCL